VNSGRQQLRPVQDFLGLSDEDMVFIEVEVALATPRPGTRPRDRRVETTQNAALTPSSSGSSGLSSSGPYRISRSASSSPDGSTATFDRALRGRARTEALQGRVAWGDSVEAVAKDLGLTKEQVEQAVALEQRAKRKAA
jgi:hypothetical protein